MFTPDRILHYWFGVLKGPESYPEDKASRWFAKNEKVDNAIREEFLPYLEAEGRGELEYWCASPHGTLAMILLLDQFPRNIYRDKATAYSHDSKALSLSLDGIKRELDNTLYPVERAFFYMPLMHAENMEVQRLSVEYFQTLLDAAPSNLRDALERFRDHAIIHHDTIKRFGRYPHRNQVLGRSNTEEEDKFLTE